MRKQREEEYLSGNLTAMIDVVFQLIIFFVCTSSMQDASIDRRIFLALAPHGAAVTAKDPREITIDVDSKGHVSIAKMPLSMGELKGILRKTVSEYGTETPIIIRGDSKVTHVHVRNVMEACTAANIWKIKFAALKERGS